MANLQFFLTYSGICHIGNEKSKTAKKFLMKYDHQIFEYDFHEKIIYMSGYNEILKYELKNEKTGYATSVSSQIHSSCNH